MHVTKIVAMPARITPVMLKCTLGEIWEKLTGEVRPHSAGDARHSLSQEEIDQCLRDYGHLFCFVVNTRGDLVLKFKPDITRDVVEEAVTATEAGQSRGTYPLLKAWKVFFMTAESYYIGSSLIKEWQRQGLTSVPSLVVEAIRYNPAKMAGSCWYIEGSLSDLSKLGGPYLRQFLRDIQHHKVVYREKGGNSEEPNEEYEDLAIVKLLTAIVRNDVALEKNSLLEQRIDVMLGHTSALYAFYCAIKEDLLPSVSIAAIAHCLDNPDTAQKLLQGIYTLLAHKMPLPLE